MAPRKDSSSSASTGKTRKSSSSSGHKSTPTIATSITRTSGGRATKQKSPTKQRSPTKIQGRTSPAKQRQLEDEAALSSRRDQGRRAHFNESLSETDEPTTDADRVRGKGKEPARPQNQRRTPPTTTNRRRPAVEPPKAQTDSAPNKPSYQLEPPRPRNVAKPDPAKGESYAIKKDDDVYFDQRETIGYLMHFQDLHQLVDKMQGNITVCARQFASLEQIAHEDEEGYLSSLQRGLTGELRRYAGFIAVGGPCGVAGWEEIFLNSQLRQALVAGVIWLALKQHVFESLWFGADEELMKKMEAKELEMKGNEDGKCGQMTEVHLMILMTDLVNRIL